ncbi:MAG: hypothetical protein PHE84_12520 [bacterium]|nr:hypothetical protein [bacterium]
MDGQPDGFKFPLGDFSGFLQQGRIVVFYSQPKEDRGRESGGVPHHVPFPVPVLRPEIIVEVLEDSVELGLELKAPFTAGKNKTNKKHKKCHSEQSEESR